MFSSYEQKRLRKLLHTDDKERPYKYKDKTANEYHHEYRTYLNRFKDSIGRGNINPNYDPYQMNTYGKSFD